MILHVACLPFPSHQGTQAAIDAMLRASAKAGQAPHLLTYAHGGRAQNAPCPYPIHRLPDFPEVRSLRSGPSLGKVALDLQCVTYMRGLCRRLRPTAILAHHIEAALASLAAGVTPVYYVAHTSLERELPLYFPDLLGTPIALAGRVAERFVCHRATAVGAVAPSLATIVGPSTTYLPVPWPCRVDGPSREEARLALGIPAEAPICLYAGNLDRYQGWEALLAAMKRLRDKLPNARLLLATESNPDAATREAAARGVCDALLIRPLSGERARALAHAAADVACIPRRSEGGLPIKMLDAFSRSTPVVATSRATAGLPIHEACEVVPDDDPHAFAGAIARVIAPNTHAQALCKRAHRYLAFEHSANAYRDALRRLLGPSPLSLRKATPNAQRPQGAQAPRAH